MKSTFTSLLVLFIAAIAMAQPAVQQSVMLENDTSEAPGFFTLKWNSDPGATQYRIFRKTPQASNWGGNPLAVLDPTATSWTDSTVSRGEAYEYRVQKLASGYTGYGYMTAGVELLTSDNAGRVLVLVEQQLYNDLDQEIMEMTRDLESESWLVNVQVVGTNESPAVVKDSIIRNWYQDDVQRAKGIILLGHVPVPYSGLIFPDGHTDHQGAWPADGYYGDMDGSWTDWQVNNTAGNQSRHHNVPGDGKFDQSSFPSELELWVGRIDFSKLPAFPESEAQLTRAYLEKLHRFKTGQFRPEPRGVIEDNFSGFQEGFSQNGWKNFAPIVGMDSVFARDYTGSLRAGSYLFSYGCGGGSYTSSGGISNTATMVTDSLQTVFTMLFGSYFGDWDINNNFLRAALASGTVLTNFWAGRPHWQFHQMAMGATMGDCARNSMNNIALYTTGFGARGVHMALLGDPTLQWYYIKPPSGLQWTEKEHRIELSWTASEDPVDGYFIYRKNANDPEYLRINEDLVQDTRFVDSCLVAVDTFTYLVRAVDLVRSASGSYYGQSLGATATVTPANDYLIEIDYSVSAEYEEVRLTNTSINANSFEWTFGDGGSSNEADPVYQYTKADSVFDVEICLIARNICNLGGVVECRELSIMGSLPRIENVITSAPLCAQDSTIGWMAILAYPGAEPLGFSPSVTRNGSELSAELINGTEIVTVTNDLGDQLNFGPYLEPAPEPIAGSYEIREPDADLLNNGKIIIKEINGGVPPYEILWSTGSTADEISDLTEGIYWVDITDGNKCTRRDSFELKLNTSTYSFRIEGVRIFPNPTSGRLFYEDALDRAANIQLADLTGRIFARWSTEGQGSRELNIPAALAPGLYQLLVEIDGRRGTFPIILLPE